MVRPQCVRDRSGVSAILALTLDDMLLAEIAASDVLGRDEMLGVWQAVTSRCLMWCRRSIAGTQGI